MAFHKLKFGTIFLFAVVWSNC